MLENIMQNPAEKIKYIVMIILAIILFFWYRSIPSSKGNILRNPKAEKKLKKDFATITEAHFEPDRDDYMLVIGMSYNIQKALKKESNPEEAYMLLPAAKQNVLCLGYLFEDSGCNLSDFFSFNMEPILSGAEKAVNEVIGGEYAELYSKEYVTYDFEKDELSMSKDDKKSIDFRFSELMKKQDKQIYKKAADYIRADKQIFLS